MLFFFLLIASVAILATRDVTKKSNSSCYVVAAVVLSLGFLMCKGAIVTIPFVWIMIFVVPHLFGESKKDKIEKAKKGYREKPNFNDRDLLEYYGEYEWLEAEEKRRSWEETYVATPKKAPIKFDLDIYRMRWRNATSELIYHGHIKEWMPEIMENFNVAVRELLLSINNSGMVDLNSASLEDLIFTAGLTEEEALKVVDHRENAGYFENTYQLWKDNIMARNRYAEISDRVFVLREDGFLSGEY